MSEVASVSRPHATLGSTDRRDAWWLGPAITFLVLSSFVIYATLRAFMNRDYEIGELLSPFYSPNLAHWTPLPQWLSPALLILWAPGGFRMTCYYYRKAYYRSFGAHPPGCAVSEGKKRGYRGETAFPFILQNLHRYLLYAALFVLIFLWYDVWKALWPGGRFGVTVGTIVLLANTSLLTLYTFSCHSLRHLIGGNIDCFSCSASTRARQKLWGRFSLLNANHMSWAWLSLFGVAFADFYVWMVASGRFVNWRII
jgi:hypothetical protein